MQGSHQHNSARLWIATIATSLVYAAAHPPLAWWPLALLAVAPASAVLLDPRARVPWPRAAAAGFVFGLVTTWLMVGHWSWLAARDFFGHSTTGFTATLPAAAFIAAIPVLASGIALHYAIAFALVARLAGLGAAAGVIGSAGIWSATELVRTSVGYGNPWGAFSAALIAADAALSGFRAETPVAGLLAIGGPPLVAFVATAVGSAVGLAFAQRTLPAARGRALAAGSAVALPLVLAGYANLAWLPLRNDSAAPREPLRVALVQPGVGKGRPWERAAASESFARHVELTRGFETGGADLIVWPENALPFLLDANVDKVAVLRELARDRGAALLIGGSRSAPAAGGRANVYNSAFLFPPDGGEPQVYDKQILLPFVEHVPAWAAPLLASREGEFVEGAADAPALFLVRGWRVVPLVGLESIYPGVVAARTAKGADLLVNMSNDSRFDAGAGVEQHFSLAMLAAAMTRRPLVRVATTGVSALVLEDGLVSWRLPVRAGAVALLDVPAPAHDSLFVHGGRSGVALLVVAVAAAAAALPAWLRRIS